MNTIKRENVVIQLLDEEHKPMFSWSLKDTWPIQLTGTDLDEYGEVN